MCNTVSNFDCLRFIVRSKWIERITLLIPHNATQERSSAQLSHSDSSLLDSPDVILNIAIFVNFNYAELL